MPLRRVRIWSFAQKCSFGVDGNWTKFQKHACTSNFVCEMVWAWWRTRSPIGCRRTSNYIPIRPLPPLNSGLMVLINAHTGAFFEITQFYIVTLLYMSARCHHHHHHHRGVSMGEGEVYCHPVTDSWMPCTGTTALPNGGVSHYMITIIYHLCILKSLSLLASSLSSSFVTFNLVEVLAEVAHIPAYSPHFSHQSITSFILIIISIIIIISQPERKKTPLLFLRFSLSL